MKHVISALIVDDEPPAVRRLKRLLAAEPDIELVGECGEGAAAVEAIRQHQPDLVFLDIQLPELDGFGVLAELPRDKQPVVVFVTAFDEYALSAFDVHAADYLLKPYDRERFQAALARAREQLAVRNGLPPHSLDEPTPESPTIDRFVVKSNGRIVFVPADKVECIESEGNYLKLHVGSRHLRVRGTMANLEARLDRRRFMRVHRSWIINLDRVREVQPLFKGQYRLILANDRIVPVGGAFIAQLNSLVLSLR